MVPVTVSAHVIFDYQAGGDHIGGDPAGVLQEAAVKGNADFSQKGHIAANLGDCDTPCASKCCTWLPCRVDGSCRERRRAVEYLQQDVFIYHQIFI